MTTLIKKMSLLLCFTLIVSLFPAGAITTHSAASVFYCDENVAVIGDTKFIHFPKNIIGENKNITSLIIQNTQSGHEITVTEILEGDEQYNAVLSIPEEDWAVGDWSVVSVTEFLDEKYNTTNVEEMGANFLTVYKDASELPDTPVTNVSYAKAQFDASETNTLFFTLNAKYNDVESIIVTYGNKFGPDEELYSTNATRIGTSLNFRAELSVSKYAEADDWRIEAFTLIMKNESDKTFTYNNYGFIRALPKFKVLNANADTTPPKIHSVEIDGDVIQAGQPASVVVNASDNLSQVNNIIVVFRNPNVRESSESHYTLDNFKYIGKNKWLANGILPATSSEGNWQLEIVHVSDNASNATTRKYSSNSYTETNYSKSSSSTITVKTYAIERFVVMKSSKIVKKDKKQLQVKTFSNRTVYLYSKNKLVSKTNSAKSGITKINHSGIAKNSKIKLVIKNRNNKTTETINTTY